VTPVIIESETVQSFNGERFFRSGTYFNAYGAGGGRRLHRVVWEFHNGVIPPKCHIHHIDGNPANNDISNLQCLSSFEHLSEHNRKKVEDGSHPWLQPENITKRQEGAREWHQSPEGREWHRQHARDTAKRTVVDGSVYHCIQCGEPFLALRSASGMCGQACRKRAAAGLDGPPKRRGGATRPRPDVPRVHPHKYLTAGARSEAKAKDTDGNKERPKTAARNRTR
jgi:hypothetical protein